MARLLARLAPIEPGEARAVAAAFSLFFFMWAGYFSVRPVRETVGTLLGAAEVANLWMFTAIGAVLIVPLYGAVVARLPRRSFLPWTYGIVAAVLVLVAIGLRGDMVPWAGRFFYVFISVLNMFLISMFWSFMLELFDRGQAKRLFGAIAAGGSTGALAGPLASDMTVAYIGESGVLLLGAALFVGAIACQRVLLRVWTGQAPPQERAPLDRPLGGNPFAGFTLLARSPYLLGIALFVVLLSLVTTLLYFEQLRLVESTFAERADRTRVFARIDWIVQGLTLLSQIFLTGRIATRFGVTVLLTLVPLIMILGFVALAASGTFAVLAVVMILRRATEYAFARPGREMLWSPLDRETKYKAKSTVDVPVYRGADLLAAQANSALTAAGIGGGGVALIGAVAAACWGLVGWWLGRRYEAQQA